MPKLIPEKFRDRLKGLFIKILIEPFDESYLVDFIVKLNQGCLP